MGKTDPQRRKGNNLHPNQTVSDMATEVLVRQAKIDAELTGRPLLEALAAVLETQAGRQLQALREGPHHDRRANEWQERVAQKRAQKQSIVLGLHDGRGPTKKRA